MASTVLFPEPDPPVAISKTRTKPVLYPTANIDVRDCLSIPENPTLVARSSIDAVLSSMAHSYTIVPVVTSNARTTPSSHARATMVLLPGSLAAAFIVECETLFVTTEYVCLNTSSDPMDPSEVAVMTCNDDCLPVSEKHACTTRTFTSCVASTTCAVRKSLGQTRTDPPSLADVAKCFFITERSPVSSSTVPSTPTVPKCNEFIDVSCS